MTIKNEKGAALVVTLLVVVIMTVTVTEFLYSTWVDRSLAANFRDSAKTLLALRSGIEAGRAVVEEDARIDGKKGLFIDTLREYWAQPALPIPIDDTYMFLAITDESSKIDLNRLVTAGGYPDEKWIAVFRRLLHNRKLDEDIAQYVLDWIDKNGEGPAEDGYYLSSDHPYLCKNAKLDSVEELKRIRGITPEVFSQIRPFVTVRSSGWININTASRDVIMALDDDITPSLAQSALDARSELPFKSKEEIKNITGFSGLFPRISNLIDVKTDTFSVSATITINEMRRRADAIITERNTMAANIIYYRVN